ncbi:MAG: MFS transporter [Myxococcales bacterium]|nr:MFS transporter [Myxococcales bacterium]
MASFFSVFRSRRVGWLTPIGFAAGLPFLLSQGSLQTWLTVEKVDVSTIGLFTLVGVPYNLKFLWAPLLDRYSLPGFGRRRGWMLAFQALIAAFVFALGLLGVQGNLAIVAALALGLSFVSASFDVVVDAHRTDLLAPSERAAGTATFVTGYRVALNVTGALALILADTVTWRWLYFAFAALMALGLWFTWRVPEPEMKAAPRTLTEAVVEPFIDFFRRKGALIALAFVISFRVGDTIATTMITPFLIRTVGFSQAEVGTVNKFFGSLAAIAGSFLGGAVVAKWGLRRPLFVLGGLAALTNVLYAVLAHTGKSFPMLFIAVGFDSFAGGMGSAAFVAFLMTLAASRYSATQYALLTSVSSVGGRALGAWSGFLARELGWSLFFLITAAFILPALLFIAILPRSVEAANATPEAEPPPPRPPGC